MNVVDRLEALGLLKRRPSARRLKGARPENTLPVLCEAGSLEGGLSVALDVRPDEAFGALCSAIGGKALQLRVADVRDRPEPELVVAFDGRTEGWAVPDVAALVHNLNDLLRDDPEARVVAVLGDWNDALQLWCLPKAKLPLLQRERFFEPRNARELFAREADDD